MGNQGLTAVLIGSAPGQSLSCIRKYLTGKEAIFCCDGGVNLAREYGLKPDWYIGDSDSGGVVPEGIPNWLLPSEKDLTDMEMAAVKAEEQGFCKMILCACTGGRLDHEMVNLSLLERLYRKGVDARIVDDRNEIRFLAEGKLTIPNYPPYRYISLLPADSKIGGLCIRGCKYRMEDGTVERGSSLTVSNELAPDGTAEIIIGSGCGWLVRSIPL